MQIEGLGPADDGVGVTPGERKVLELLAEALEQFASLDGGWADDNVEFRQALRAAQNVVAYRVARRVDPDGWWLEIR